MDAQLAQIIAEQNRLLRNQLRWLKVSLLTLLLTATASVCCLSMLIRERSVAAGKVTVVTTEPILEHPMSLAENESNDVQFPVRTPTEHGGTLLQIINRLTVPPMEKATPIEFSFPKASIPERRGCDGMCF